ncbi:hypothetical protein RRF57_012003 [Xylaria bambusicola]|uniref:Uncharacterized protein n=1 Tax=Xylaria bambusicola TaxID=326684 RepID=A0AAN7ZDE6_9PEZI
MYLIQPHNMKGASARLFHALQPLRHENPLGLPRTGSIPRMQRGLPERRKIQDVARVVAVSSAKGGVGKSTVAVSLTDDLPHSLKHTIRTLQANSLVSNKANLSLAFARMGYRAGILDTDIFGPSIPTLFDLSGEPRLSSNNQLLPLSNYGVKTMSMGYLVGEDAPVAWRGLMVMKALQQLLHEYWICLQARADTQLSVTQQIVLDGSVIVTTPHTLAVKDAVKGINMFKKVNVPLLGLVQNMSLFSCPHCHQDTAVFGSNERVRELCQNHSLDLLGNIPLHQNVGDDRTTRQTYSCIGARQP